MPPVLESPSEPLETLFDQVESVSVQTEPPPAQTAASLVSGILGDLRNLVEQQFQLTRMQIEAELRQRFVAVSIFSAGVVVLFVSTIFICFSLSHLLHWIASPAGTDPATYPLWMCHAAVAAGLGLTGGILAWTGVSKFGSVAPFQNPVSGLFQETPK
jgi:hypothetical protein